MSFEEFDKINKDLSNLTDSLYSMSKGQIKQDDLSVKQDATNEAEGSISVLDKLKSYWNKIKNLFRNIKNKLLQWKIDKALYFIFAGLKSIFLFIYYTIPLLILVYVLFQIGLFISTHVLTLFDKFDSGWNDKFIKSLPLIFQPAKYKFGQFLTTVLAFIIGSFLVIWTNEFGRYRWYVQLLLNAATIGILTLLFLMPEQVNMYVGKAFLYCFLALIGWEILKALFSGDSSSGSDGYSSSSNYSSSRDYSSRRRSSDSSSNDYNSADNEPQEKTLKIHKVTQFGNTVQIIVGDYVNGKYRGTGAGYGKVGQLLNWNDSTVTIRENNGWVRTYGLHGEIVNSWLEK